MNLDSLSLALSQISYLVDNLTKKNYRASQQEIQHVSRWYFGVVKYASFLTRNLENKVSTASYIRELKVLSI